MLNPRAKRMKFSTKDVLILTMNSGAFGRDAHRANQRHVFYVNTDAEKVEFIRWFIEAVQDDAFDDAGWFSAHVATFPSATHSHKSALFFEAHHSDGEELERAFPITSEADKLALYELLITGGLSELLGVQHSAGWMFRLVKMQEAMDTEQAIATLDAKLPTELAEKIVGTAVHEAE